jgi:hypothetical protein
MKHLDFMDKLRHQGVRLIRATAPSGLTQYLIPDKNGTYLSRKSSKTTSSRAVARRSFAA